jgi:hypothetical protein
MPSPWSGDEVQTGWSRDGAWLYVSRAGAEGRDIWRRPAGDGDTRAAVRISRGGGFRATESPDGTTVLYTRSRRPTDGIWRSDMDGGDPQLVVALEAGELLGWALGSDSVYFGYRLEPDDSIYHVASIDLVTGARSELFEISSRLGFELDVDPVDGRILFDRTDALDADIVALRDAR